MGASEDMEVHTVMEVEEHLEEEYYSTLQI